ncbi:MAG: Ig-like domain-containing protein [Bacillota bacterium]
MVLLMRQKPKHRNRYLLLRQSLMTAVMVACCFICTGTAALAAGWRTETVDSGGVVGEYTGIAVDSSAYAHISYYDGTNTDLKHAYQDSSGWHTEFAQASAANDIGQWTSIDLDGSDYPYISHYGASGNNLKYTYQNVSGWNNEGPDSTGDVGKYTSTKVDASNYPHVSYYDATNIYLKYAYKDAGGWHIETADTGAGTWTSLALDSSGYPHISYKYSGTSDLRYAYKDAGGWHIESVDTAGNTGGHTAIVLDGSNYPHISYRDITNAKLKYAYKDGSGWHIEDVTVAGNDAWYTSIALDSSGYPHISYYDYVNFDLGYAYKDGSGWHISTVDGTGDVGAYTAIALVSDIPRISYYDGTNGDLKYAWWDPDTVAPTVQSTDPVDSATDVIVGKTITVTFSENIQAGSAYASVNIKDQTGADVAFAKSIAGDVLTIDPTSNLSYSVSYTVYVPANSIKDMGDNGLAADCTFSFTTEADTTPPAVQSTDPANGAAGVVVGKTITVTFSENIQAGDNYAQITLKDNNNNNAAFTKSIADAVLTIDPTGDLNSNLTYTASIPAGAIKDLLNNATTSEYSFSFTTENTGSTATVDSTGNVGQYTSIKVDGSNNPRISYYDVTNADLKYAYKDGSGWHTETIDSTGTVGLHTSLAIDASGYPRISYSDNTNYDLKYAYKDAAGWHTETADSGGSVGQYSSIALDGSGYPHISYHDWIFNYDLKYAYKDAGGWHAETVDGAGSTGTYTSIALSVLNYPYISYYDYTNYDLKLAYKDAGGWHTETVDGATYMVGSYTSIALNGSGYPCISYYDDSNDDLMYAYKDAGGWHTETVDSTGSVGSYTSLALDTSGYPHISYYDGSPLDLKYAYKDGSGWHLQTLDSNGTVGQYTSIDIDSSNYAHISYYDTTNGDLKYIWTGDTSAPTVSSTGPASGATGVLVGQTITVNFSENVQTGDNYASINLKDESGNDVAFVKSINGAALTIDPTSNLDYSVTYTVYVPAGCVEDMVGSALAADNNFSFTTEADTYGPTVSSTNPGNGTGCVPTGQTITVTFGENVQAGSSYASINLKDQYGNNTAFGKSINGQVLSIDPTSNLKYSVTYTVYVPADSIDDLLGNGTDSDYTFNFTTGTGTGDMTIVDGTGSVGQYASIALDGSGYPHISYYDSFVNYDLKYAYKDAGGWHTETLDSAGSVGTYTSLALDASNYPHISYYDGTNYDLKYAYKDAGGWHTETVDSAGSVGQYTSIALDNSNYPYISYYDATNYDLKYAYKDAGGWHVETAEGANSVGMFTSISLDASNYPHISYYDNVPNYDLRYTYKDAGGWHAETVDNSATYPGQYTSIKLNASGYPHIGHYDGSSADLKYAYKDAGGWHLETVDSAGSVGSYTSLDLDASDYPHISYFDGGNWDLKYAFKDGSGWHTYTVDCTGMVGQFTSLVLDTNDVAHISYYTVTNADLKYVSWSPGSSPAVDSTDPAGGTVDVVVEKTVTVTFDADIQAGDNYAQIDVKHQNGTSIPFTKSIAGAVLTIDPTGNLANSVSYTVYVPENAVKDLNNNGLADDYTFSFTTEADAGAPTVQSTDPANGATSVAIDKTITVTFNEDIQAGDNYGLVNLKDQGGVDVAFTKSIAGAVLTIDPDSDLSNSVTYTVYVPAGSVKDLTNNALAADYTFSFTTISGSTTISIIAPDGVSGWSLDPSAGQPETESGTLSVTVDPAGTPWEVTAADSDTVNTNGRMTAWNGSYDTDSKLQNAMKIAGDYEVTLPSGGKIADGAGGGSVPVTFKQTVGWVDQPLSGGYSYKIVVTFTASVTV